MRAVYVEKNIPRMLLTKAVAPYWPDFVWSPLSAARAGELPDPGLPGPRWLRVKNLACGICATDLSLLYVKADPSVAPAALPGVSRFFLGHEAVGVVTETGPQVSGFNVGDRVIMDKHFYGANCLNLEIQPCEMCSQGETNFCFNKSEQRFAGFGGGFGDEYVTHETSIFPCPADLTLDQAVLVEPLGIGTHAVLRHLPDTGDKVLVIGSGTIGLSVLMALKTLRPECVVSIITRHDFQSKISEELGADHILGSWDGYGKLAAIAGGKFYSAPFNRGVIIDGFNVIYDCVGSERTINDSLRWVRANGKVVLVGAHMNPMARLDLVNIWYHQVDLVGVVGHSHEKFEGQTKHTYQWVVDFIQAGSYRIDQLITHRFPFTDFKQAVRLAAAGRGLSRAVKVILQNG